jgi:two-component system response regulator AtoC
VNELKSGKYRVLVADDEENLRALLKEVLESEGYLHVIVDNGEEAVKAVKEKGHDLDCALLDVRMPKLDGMEAFLKIKEIDPQLPVIFLTAYGSSDIAIKAMKKGAYDYLTKPFDIEELKIKIKKAIDLKEITQNAIKTKSNFKYTSDEIIGDSLPMQEVYKEIGRVADSDATVLIRGESGTGKELVAKALHNHSDKRGNPFVVVNCAAIPEALLESELFGHEKGSFTDAIARHIGKFEQAADGTIFLDEIGDMTLSLQSKLLRVLQDKTFTRVGGNESLTAKARIITATNRDLEDLVSSGRFREDLFYRLNIVTITLPPLKDRKEDIPLLSSYFVSKFSKKYGRDVKAVSPEVMDLFLNYDWPGNVRELENTIARGVIVTSSTMITVDNLPKEMLVNRNDGNFNLKENGAAKKNLSGTIIPLPELIASVEKEAISKALLECSGNKTKAAKLLGISRKSLFNKLRQYNLISDEDESNE